MFWVLIFAPLRSYPSLEIWSTPLGQENWTLNHLPLEILPKNAFWTRAVFWSLSCYKELKLTIKPFTGHTLHSLLIQMQNISLWSSGMHRKQNFWHRETAVLTSTFRFLSSPLFQFFCLIFFSFAGHLVGFILVGIVFRKPFSILGLEEWKGRWIVEQDFHENFQVNVTRVFAFSPVSLTELYSFWYGLKILFTLHKLADKVVLDH